MEYNTDFQKDIWLKHIEVQERVLQLNSAPIVIEPDSIQIFGKRMHLKVCQTDEIDAKISSIKAFFNGFSCSLLCRLNCVYHRIRLNELNSAFP